MKKLIFFALGVGMIALASSCNKYDFSEGEMNSVEARFIQRDYYSIAPAVDVYLTDSYVDSLDIPNYNNGLGDTVQLVITNPYNVPFSFEHDIFSQGYGHLSVYDQNWNQLDKTNLTITNDTVLVTLDCGPLLVGESKSIDIKIKHKDFLIKEKHYTASRQY